MPSWRDGRKPQSSAPKAREVREPRSSPASAPQAAPVAKGSWKGGKKVAAGPKWQRGDGGTTFQLTRSFWVRTGAALTVVLVGYLIYLVFQQPTATPIIALAVLDYEKAPNSENKYLFHEPPWPPNSWTSEDLTHLGDVNPENIRLELVEGTLFRKGGTSAPLLETLSEKLRDAKPGSPDGTKVLLVYLSMHTAENSEGEPCVLPSNADPLDESTWLKFRDLDATLSQAPRDCRTVVLFDCGRLDIDPTLGIASNDFVGKAAEVVREVSAADPQRNMWYLFSHGARQRSWGAPELGGTPFGYFVAEGLRGRANSGVDKFITLRELAAFVTKNVSNWTLANRDEAQAPLLVPELNRDFNLAFAQREKLPPAAARLGDGEINNVKEGLAALDSLWSEYESKVKEIAAPDRVSAVVRGEIIRRLCQTEQRLLAGEHYSTRRSETRSLFSDLGLSSVTPDVYSSSLPLAHWRNQPVPAGEEALWTAALQETPEIATLAEAATRLQSAPQTTEAMFAQMVAGWVDPQIPTPLLRAALSCRDVAEQAACPLARVDSHYCELRFLPWTRDALVELDQRRRALEDRLFSNDWNSLAADFAGLEADYRAQLRIAQEVTLAYSLAEDCLSELIDTNRWPAYLPNLKTDGGEARLNNLDQRLEALLAALIERPGPDADIEKLLAQVQDAREDVQNYRAGLVDQLRADLETVSKLNIEGTRMRNALAAVRIPTPAFSAADRRTFHNFIFQKAFQDWQGKRSIVLAQDAAEPPAPKKEGPQAAAPAAASASGAATAVTAPVTTNREIKWLLPRSTPAQRSGSGEHLAGLLNRFPANYDALVGGRSGQSTPAQLEQALLLAQVAACGRDLHEDLLRNDEADVLAAIQNDAAGPYVIWQVQRTLDDFWGLPPVAPASEAPYFERIAKRQLAQRQLPPVERQRLDDLLAARTAAARAGLATIASNSLSFNSDAEFPLQSAGGKLKSETLNLHVEPKTDSGLVPRERPAGQAALWLTDATGSCIPIADQRRTRFDPLAQTVPDVTLAVAAGDPIVREGSAAHVLFRGHSAKRPIHTNSREELSDDIEFRPVPPTPPGIVVADDQQSRPVIYFLLDCSGSMDTPDFEGEAGATQRRWDGAVYALKNLLQQLSLKHDRFDVGLMAFGHRFGVKVVAGQTKYEWPVSEFARQESRQALRQPPIPTGINGEDAESFYQDALKKKVLICNDDVETLVKPAPFGPRELARFNLLLDELAPHGQTPLYGALRKAVEELDQRPEYRGRPRRVIVVSDGMDQLVTPANFTIGGVTFETLQSMVGTFDNRKSEVVLDVVGIGNEFKEAMQNVAEQSQAAARFRDLKQIANPYYADDRSSLLKHLERSLAPLQYQVIPVADPTRGSPILELGTVWSMNEPPKTPEEFFVRLVDNANPDSGALPVEKRVRLEGGESLKLVVQHFPGDAHRLALRFPPYGFGDDPDGGQPDGLARNPSEMTRDLSARPFAPFGEDRRDSSLRSSAVVVHQPLPNKAGDGRIFPISFQSGDEALFSPRPARLWIKALPVGQPGAVAQHWFDLEFLNSRRVPVTPVHVSHWPADASDCQLDIAFSYAPIAPDWPPENESAHLEDGPLPSIRNLGDVAFSVQMGRFGTEGYVVVVTERHPATESAPVTPRAAVTFAAPHPSRIRRRFFRTSPRIDHEFYFEATSLPGDARLEILSQQTFEDHAIRLPRPSIVSAKTD